MSEKTVAQKLQIKEGSKVLFVNPPQGYQALLGSLPKSATVLKAATEPVDVIQVFVTSKKELEEQVGKLKALLSPKGIFWVTYPKGTSKIKTDINRDIIRECALPMGLQAVAIFSVDDDWSALRLKIV